MIALTRLDGSGIAINHTQIERIDIGPDTVVTMMNGNRYIVAESFDEVLELITAYETRVHTGRLRSRAMTASRRDVQLKLAGDPSDMEGEEN